MAVAAYGAVLSLIHVLDQIPRYPRPRLHVDRNQIKTLREKVSFLQDFLEVHSQRFPEDLEDLARQIAGVARETEDMVDALVVDQFISRRCADESDIDLSFFWMLVADEREDITDSHAVDQLHEASADKSDMDLSFYCKGIDNVIERIDSIKKKLMMIKGGTTIQEQRPKVFVPAFSSTPPSGGNNTKVGFDKQFHRIVLQLIGDKCDLQVLPIVGMGGIGKTTLARIAFDDRYMVQHFDIRTWVTISQDYSMEKVLLGLLHDEESSDKKCNESDESSAELGGQLYKKLYDRRYLVVMDDVWGTEVWNGLRSFFPDNSNGSRIVVTTRLSNVAIYFSSRNPYLMDFLDDEQSWDLFCKKAFVEESCPPELEEVGKSIAKSCKGLPLAIVVIGGLLSKSNMTKVYWEFVAKDVNSFANSGDDEHCRKILSLSYNHLPIHLKPCLLFMGEFDEDSKIDASYLITLWVVKGFLKPMKDKTLEETAQECLEDLIGRNLILMCRLGINGKIKTCSMHDLVRDLCIRESCKEHFYCVPNIQIVKTDDNGFACFLCAGNKACTRIDLPRAVVASQPPSLASCLVCDNCRNKCPQLNTLRLVKVLEDSDDRWSSDRDILHPTKLRALAVEGKFNFSGDLPYLLWNLQVLKFACDKAKLCLPSEIWEMPQLRHLDAVGNEVVLPAPPITQFDRKDSTIILKNLQTLSTMTNFRWSEDAVERLPNLKTLEIHYSESDNWSYYSLHNLVRLRKLESLSLYTETHFTLKNITFPHSLKKLTLSSCEIPWEEMMIIGSLPNLEVLILYDNAFKGPNWNPVEGEFLRLKELLIWKNDLACWGAEKEHFPNLEHLKLVLMEYLEEIPSGIGEIETLHSIWLRDCEVSVVNSAKEILEEQHSFGNEDLQLYVDFKLVLPGSG